MGRPKTVTEEQKKARIHEKNKRYYESNKAKWTTYNCGSETPFAIVYAVRLPENKYYVGVSHNKNLRFSQHRATYGHDTEIDVILSFSNYEIPVVTLNLFENLLITGHFGLENCTNKINVATARDFSHLLDNMQYLTKEHQELVEKAMCKVRGE